jgi:hypothetical protein
LNAVGNAEDARSAVLAYALGYEPGVEEIGSGEDRTAYLINGVVYKVGRRASANPYDHATLQRAYEAGLPWAPPSSLYTVVDQYGEEVPVMAMPLLEDDGTEPDPDKLAELYRQTGDRRDRIDRGNYVVVGGQPIVFDGCCVTLALPFTDPGAGGVMFKSKFRARPLIDEPIS